MSRHNAGESLNPSGKVYTARFEVPLVRDNHPCSRGPFMDRDERRCLLAKGNEDNENRNAGGDNCFTFVHKVVYASGCPDEMISDPK